MKTFSAKCESTPRRWYIIDAKGKVLGRLATEIARRLRGKHKPEFTPHITGDYVVVLNAGEVAVTGNKAKDKLYYRHSGYPGGLKQEAYEKLIARRPERILELAVKGMLPKNTLGRDMMRQLKVYTGSEHPHMAQQPEILEI